MLKAFMILGISLLVPFAFAMLCTICYHRSTLDSLLISELAGTEKIGRTSRWFNIPTIIFFGLFTLSMVFIIWDIVPVVMLLALKG